MKASAIAHPMQALIKYHGLKDWTLRIPYHDSVSVNIDALSTRTKVEFGDYERDSVIINGRKPDSHSYQRCMSVINRVREISGLSEKVKVTSVNSLELGSVKGVGFSSSAGAALAAAAFRAAGLHKRFGWDLKLISRIARRLAGSACRSVVGEYARWYAGKDDQSSFASKIGTRKDLDLAMILVPLGSEIETEEAHREVTTSPFFKARIRSADRRADKIQTAIKKGDFAKVGELAEIDSLELHAVTMTGTRGLMIYRPESILVMDTIRKMHEAGKEVYFSMQTGPSVFINTYPDLAKDVANRIEGLGLKTMIARVGREVRIIY